jgi:hypothetical protein
VFNAGAIFMMLLIKFLQKLRKYEDIQYDYLPLKFASVSFYCQVSDTGSVG